jgi:hypothetical protein
MSDYPLPQKDQDKAASLAKKMLALAKGHSPAVTALAGKLIIDLVVWVHSAEGMTKKASKK